MRSHDAANATLEHPRPRADPTSSPEPLRHEALHRFRVGQADVGAIGYVDGGTLLEWIHHTASTVAVEWRGRRCVTASVGNVHLDRPIGVGEVVDVHASLVHTGRSSMHVLITVWSMDPTRSKVDQSTQCSMVFVAVDGGHPVPVPPWTPFSMLEMQRQRQARVRMRMRRRVEETMAIGKYTDRGSGPGATLIRVAGQRGASDGGTVSGRRILRWMDDACNACGAEWAGTEVLTSYLAGIRFARPVPVAHTVEVSARVIHTGPRSIHCGIRVTDIDETTTQLVAESVAVVVSLDTVGRAQDVPKWSPATDEDRRLEQHARQLIELRQFIEPFTIVAAVGR